MRISHSAPSSLHVGLTKALKRGFSLHIDRLSQYIYRYA